MSEQRLITIAGDVGSGKSTVGKILAERLNAPYTSTGKMQRELARERGVTTLQLNEQCMTDQGIDHMLDGRLRALGASPHGGVVDARLGWFFIPASFKVFLSVDPVEGARRTYAAARAEEDNSQSGAVMRNNMARRQLENQRFLALYGADCALLTNYDLVVDTTFIDAGHVVGEVLAAYAAASQEGAGPRCLLSPRRLLPTQPVAAVSGAACAEVEASISRRGFDPAEPVRVLSSEWFFAILDGHKRTSAALRLGLPLIPCETVPLAGARPIQGLPGRQFARERVKPDWLTDWEQAHAFRFLSRPDAELHVLEGN